VKRLVENEFGDSSWLIAITPSVLGAMFQCRCDVIRLLLQSFFFSQFFCSELSEFTQTTGTTTK
jgi:hypothetical protein